MPVNGGGGGGGAEEKRVGEAEARAAAAEEELAVCRKPIKPKPETNSSLNLKPT